MTNAEKNLVKQGFCLLKQTTIKIDDKTSYLVIDYARFLDPDKTDYYL